jgi:hypothetical protein
VIRREVHDRKVTGDSVDPGRRLAMRKAEKNEIHLGDRSVVRMHEGEAGNRRRFSSART